LGATAETTPAISSVERNPGAYKQSAPLEGGEFNVNIRHVENATPETYRTLVHPDTIDVWVVQQGYGTLVTGGERTADGHSGGDERFIGVGDVVFIPAGVPHGIKESVSITWLNIRFPEHRN
jgi:mannose-6-phosphate isomerase-like protein (cupin superfamily)